MRINAFSDVCLRALMLLSASPEGELLTTQAIADGVGTPYNHVSKAVLKLRSSASWTRSAAVPEACD